LGVPSFSEVLRDLMRRPTYTASPGLLSKLSGLPRATIINWLEGRVSKPRSWHDLLAVADALRLDDIEIDALLKSARHPTLAGLRSHTEQNPGKVRAGAPEPRRSSPLPRQLTELIGRDLAVTSARAGICHADTRLLTLVGTGGVGKTHLAIAVAEGLHAAFDGGVVWLPLAGVVDPAQVMPKILQALGVRETDASPVKLLKQALGTANVLLVLDNFEQVLEAASELHEVLENTERLKMLVTSRAPLRVRGECEFRVLPLTLPDLSHLPPIETLQEYTAVALFVKRARAYHRDFLLTQENARTIAAICARLDGLPLALELAAAQTRVLEPVELLRRLESSLSLLTNGTRAVNQRQQTLRNTIAWSYALLSPQQQQLFRRLAVLSGGISFAAAAAVAEVDVEHDLRVSNDFLKMLVSLADQSLLSAITSDSSLEPRFVMLETIREYALQLVSEHTELENAKRLHAEFFLRSSELADAAFATQPTIAWLQSFQFEYVNIRAALHYLIHEARDLELGARLAAALGRYWFERGLFHEGREWLERINRAGPIAEPEAGAKILLYLAFVANYETDYKAGASAAQRALYAYKKSGDRIGIAQASNALGIAAMYTGRYEEAENYFDAALATYREDSDDRGIAVALHNLGEIASEYRLDFAAAESRYEESLAIFRRLGHSMNVGSTLGVLAELHAHNGDSSEARRLSHEALQTYRRIDNQPLMAEELTRLARLELSTGDIGEAQALLRDAVELLETSFHARHIVRCLETVANLAVAVSAFPEAARFVGFTQQMREEWHLPRLPAWERVHEKVVQAVSAALPAAQYAAGLQAGRALDLVSALGEAANLIAAHGQLRGIRPARADRAIRD
jgi:predicted ATPase